MTLPLNFMAVHALPNNPSRGILSAGTFVVPCALGRSGIVRRKSEGDGGTPSGIFALRRIYFRPDRVPRPRSQLPVIAIDPGLGWSDDPADPQYNRPVRLPVRTGHESMWRYDHLYDYVIVLGYNDAPPVPGRGSAIFLHLARDGFAPTEGCVAILADAMRRLLPRLTSRTSLVVRS
jgi:L,D-peptidoglycan transpeptidase YkuD (ErfK/YbiS/YcfS/YnhG family)